MADKDSKNASHSPLALEGREVYLRIPTATLVKLVFTALICAALFFTMPFLMLLFMSVLLAVTLHPLTQRLAKFVGLTASVFLVAALVALMAAGVGFFITPVIVDQAVTLYHQLPDLSQKLAEQHPMLSHFIKKLPQKVQNADTASISPIVSHFALVGGLALGGASSVVLIYVFTIYLLFDGGRAYAWFLAFFGQNLRKKIELSCEGVAPIISAYIVGQVVTSVLCAIFTFAVLSLCKVPMAAILGVLAGIFDILPIIGFFLFAIPSALVGLTVSLKIALIVAALFLFYHLFETYVVTPFVYGNRLRLSGLVVLFFLIAGALVGGVLGALAILPVVASYPVLEKIWLTDFLGARVIKKHTQIEEQAPAEA